MITKSLSRKTPSFGQLAGYMSESGYMNSEKADSLFEIYQHCFARGSRNIAEEFLKNSEHLSKRKNGNYLYHEILSITLEQGVDMKYAKEALRELALEYIQKRCPRNMVYGCLHDDHADHIHYHLMISSNERGDSKRYWLTKKQLDDVKRHIEMHCLEHYPDLKQRPVMTATSAEKKVSRKAAEEKRRQGKLERHDRVRGIIFEAMARTQTLDDFIDTLAEKNCRYYTRGKHYGVEVQHPDGKVEKYRFATLGIHEEYENYRSTLEALEQAESYVEPTIEPEPPAAEPTPEDVEVEALNQKEADIEKVQSEFEDISKRQSSGDTSSSKDKL